MSGPEVELFLRTQERVIDQQQKMSDDLGEIKVMVREAMHTVGYIVKELDDLKGRTSRNETAHFNCPARLRTQGWANVLKDTSILVAVIGSAVAIYTSVVKPSPPPQAPSATRTTP